MDKSRLQKKHENIRQEIKAAAWRQIAETGTAALSLRSIAREMNITPPALYRYFTSREDLVNALIKDAYTEFSKALESARDSASADDHAGRLRAMCQAYRHWFVEHPQHFHLLFNSPVPGGTFQSDAGQAADQAFLILLEVIQQAVLARAMNLPDIFRKNAAQLHERFKTLQQEDSPYPDEVIYAALSIWSLVHGLTSLEFFRQLTPVLADHSEEFINLEIDRFLRSAGFSL